MRRDANLLLNFCFLHGRFTIFIGPPAAGIANLKDLTGADHGMNMGLSA
jgi:hypothetical protein